MLASESAPSAADHGEMRAWYLQAVVSRFPAASSGLVTMHLLLVAVFVAYTPGSAAEDLWRQALVLVHLVQAGIATAVGGWVHLSSRARVTARAGRAYWLLAGSYLAFGASLGAIDQLRDLSLVGYATACIGVALVLEARPAQAALLFAAAAAACGWGIGLAQDSADDRVAAQVNAVGIAAMSFGATSLLSQWRLFGWWRQRVAERAAADLEALNARLADEVARRREIEAELAALANRDPLTELDNRRGFVARMESGGRRVAGCLLLVDVDHLKQLNDAFGHPAGDAALRAVGRLLREGVRSDDAVARLGGDEFGVLLPGASPAEGEALGESLRRAVEQAHIGGEVPLTVSVGVGAREAGEPFERCFGRVDAALYRAKAAGRNRVSA